jgi:peptidoglycan/LPS O-acetylase OafA/YrhL
MTPEHLHLALNHVPLIGLICAIVPLAIGLFTRNRPALIAGLVLVTVCGWVTPVVMETGEEAYERYEEGPVARFLDPQAGVYLEQHEERAEKGSKVMLATAVLGTLALGASFWRQRVGQGLAVLVIVGCLASAAAGIWIADSGGKIRRPDFRKGAVQAAGVAPSRDGDRD